MQWKVGDRVACPFLAPDSSGLSTCTTTLSTGEEKVYVEVRDPQNATTTTSVELDLQVSLPPIASIQSPFADGIYYSDVLIAFEGQVSDPEDQNEDLDVVWTSTLEGDINVDTSIDSFGMITDFAYLGAGEHGIKLTVTDSSGKVSTDSVTITVKDSNTEPTCQITAPDNESVGQLGQSVVFQFCYCHCLRH